MAPQQTRRELTTTEQATAHGMAMAGKSYYSIATHSGVHRLTVARVIARAEDDPENGYRSKPRGAPRKTIKQKDQKLQKQAQDGYTKRRRPLEELHHNIMPEVFCRTVRSRIFEKNKVCKYPATEQPASTPQHMIARLERAQRYRQYKTAKDWSHMIWTNGVAVAQDDGKRVT